MTTRFIISKGQRASPRACFSSRQAAVSKWQAVLHILPRFEVMLPYFSCCVVALLGFSATLACAAPDEAHQQTERLHVRRLTNGFVAITAEQNVSSLILSYTLQQRFTALAKTATYLFLSFSGGFVVHRGSTHIFRSVSPPTRPGCFQHHVEPMSC